MANEQSSTANAPNTPDNLKLITGIGPAIERRLHEAGVYTFAQLAALTAAGAGALVGDVAGMSPERISQQGWIEQARELAAESAPAATDVTTQTSGNNQHYATFTVELLLDDQNNVRRTRVVYVQNRNESAWVGWQASRLLEFIGKQANVHFPAEVSAIPKETPAPSLVTNVSSEPTLLSQPVDLQRMVLVYPSPTPDQPQPDNGQRTPDPPVEITPAPGEPAIEGTVQIIPLDAGVPSSIIEHGQPYHIQFTLQLTKMTAASIASRGYGVTVYAKRLSDGQRQIIGEAGGIVPSAEILHSEIPGVPLPRDTYRLEGTVTLSAATEITAVLRGGFLQVY